MVSTRKSGGLHDFRDSGDDDYDAKQELIDREQIQSAYERSKRKSSIWEKIKGIFK